MQCVSSPEISLSFCEVSVLCTCNSVVVVGAFLVIICSGFGHALSQLVPQLSTVSNSCYMLYTNNTFLLIILLSLGCVTELVTGKRRSRNGDGTSQDVDRL